MENYIIQGLLVPLTLYIAKVLVDRAKKQHEEKNKTISQTLKAISDMQQLLVTKVDEVEENKASKKEIERINNKIKELWHTFREDQKEQATELGYLKGAIEKD